MAKKCYVGIADVARLVKKGYVGVGLSSSYTCVEYIESSGTQYIDTGIAHSSSKKIVLAMDLAYTTVDPTNQIMGFSGSGGCGIGLAKSSWWEIGTTAVAGTRYSVEFGVDGTSVYRIIDGTTYSKTRSATSFTSNLFLMAAHTSASNATLNYYCSCKLYGAKVWVDDVLVRDFVPCINSSDAVGLYDKQNDTFYGNNGSGSFTAGTSTGTVISPSFARRIKKGYVGVGGVARPFWSNEEAAYYGQVTSFTTARSHAAATSIGQYALFGGGLKTDATRSSAVDAYNKSLTHTTTSISGASYDKAAASVGNYAIFFHGPNLYSGTAFDKSLSKTRLNTSSSGRAYLGIAGTSLGSHALFGGGYEAGAYYATVYAYDTSLTLSNPASLSSARSYLAATSVGDYALFGGGENNDGEFNVVDAYNMSHTRTTAPALASARSEFRATTVGDYAIFAGGSVSEIDVYNTSLTKISATGMRYGRFRVGATTLNDVAIIAGGNYSGADVYDVSLTKKFVSSSGTDYCSVGTTTGNFALFAGTGGEVFAFEKS